MKTHILRAPETDRKKVLVPNLLTDLDDYLSSQCSALLAKTTSSISAADADAIAQGTPTVLSPPEVELTHAVNTAGVITVGNGGMFLVTAQITWIAWTSGAAHAAPDNAHRASYVDVAGAQYALTEGADSDSISFVVRIAASANVSFNVIWDNGGGASSGNWTGSLSLAKIAP